MKGKEVKLQEVWSPDPSTGFCRLRQEGGHFHLGSSDEGGERSARYALLGRGGPRGRPHTHCTAPPPNPRPIMPAAQTDNISAIREKWNVSFDAQVLRTSGGLEPRLE
ncbi:hypothetical protein AAFF_G00432690 [Aldrovandia affinis]|uniref:Uncharacterized protein n=1 Tax=Aldrovandia affinis TaxID=143900 RepID=A0AAD7S8E7_9TELE|nr:hypothetical protein AAFF_G00432690 [Aldrovandia affinis]